MKYQVEVTIFHPPPCPNRLPNLRVHLEMGIVLGAIKRASEFRPTKNNKNSAILADIQMEDLPGCNLNSSKSTIAASGGKMMLWLPVLFF